MITRKEQIATILGKEGSRCNKMHLAAGWGFEWKWEGDGPSPSGVMCSRMLFSIDGEWRRAKSWDEDVRPLLKEQRASDAGKRQVQP